MDKVIEAMADIIVEGICEENPSAVIVKDLLNLRYENGSQMLAVLSENQETLENPCTECTYGHPDFLDACYDQCDRFWKYDAQQDMLTIDKDGYAFRRVKV